MGAAASGEQLRRRIQESAAQVQRLRQRELRRVVDLKVTMRAEARSGRVTEAERCAREMLAAQRQADNLGRTVSTLRSLAQHQATAESMRAVSDCVRDLSQHLQGLSNHLNVPGLTSLMSDFQRQTESLNALNDTVQDTLEDSTSLVEDDDGEAKRLVGALLDAERLALVRDAADAPVHALPARSATESQALNEQKHE